MVKCRTRHPDKLGIRKSPEFKLKLKFDPTLWVKEIINWFWHRSNFLGWWLRTAFVWMGHEPPHAGSNQSINHVTNWLVSWWVVQGSGGGGGRFVVLFSTDLGILWRIFCRQHFAAFALLTFGRFCCRLFFTSLHFSLRLNAFNLRQKFRHMVGAKGESGIFRDVT